MKLQLHDMESTSTHNLRKHLGIEDLNYVLSSLTHDIFFNVFPMLVLISATKFCSYVKHSLL